MPTAPQPLPAHSARHESQTLEITLNQLARNALLFSLIAEGATGLTVLVSPALVARLLFDANLEDAGVAIARLLGMTLLCLVVACWPRANAPGGTRAAFSAVFAYNLLAALYLAFFAMTSPPSGILLWPAVAEHLILAALLLKPALHATD